MTHVSASHHLMLWVYMMVVLVFSFGILFTLF
jgi:hypothetical protein